MDSPISSGRSAGIYAKPFNSTPIEWSAPSIEVVSLGCGSHNALSDAAISSIESADKIFGSELHFQQISPFETAADKIPFPSPLSHLAELLLQSNNKNQKVVVLASGDALFYGIGTWLLRLVGNPHLHFYPNISSIQACFHHIGLAWQNAEVVSLHGRPLSTLRRYIAHGATVAAFTDQQSGPVQIANELVKQGFSESRIWVCEAMGNMDNISSEDQRVTCFSAKSLSQSLSVEFHRLNVCVILMQREPAIRSETLPEFPGIADAHFSTGSEPGFGMISKREVRLTILSLMQPSRGEIAWDIGAGCGSVSVEWARWNSHGEIYAIESDPKRIKHIEINSARFGTETNLKIIEASAPEGCASLPQPDCIFVGGSHGLESMLEFAWKTLQPGGKLVATAVTPQSIEALSSFTQSVQNTAIHHEWVELKISKNLPGKTELRALNPVIAAKFVKT